MSDPRIRPARPVTAAAAAAPARAGRRGADRPLRQRRAGGADDRRRSRIPIRRAAPRRSSRGSTRPGAAETVWALDTGEAGENGLIGLISLKAAGEGVAEIGYWVAPAFWNAGYAGEAVEAVVAEARAAGPVAR